MVKLENQLEIIDFSIEMMKAAGDSKLSQYQRNAQIMHQNVNNFYHKALRPHRFAYQVYSKVPLSRGTIQTLVQNMMARLNAFEKNLEKLNELGIEYNAQQSLEIIKDRIQRLTEGGRYKHLRRILRVTRYIMVRINEEILEKDLVENQEVLKYYHKAANRLFRANDLKSVRCYALWALKRRHIHMHSFEEYIINAEFNAEKWETESISRV